MDSISRLCDISKLNKKGQTQFAVKIKNPTQSRDKRVPSAKMPCYFWRENSKLRVFPANRTLLRSPDREDLTPEVVRGVRLLKSGFMTSSALLASVLRGVSKEESEVEEETGLSTISILVA
jgi:hypothetical protein